ncbi:putative deacylase [Opitutaceae bacterium TAV1]|nr:putative deacylase [Opitutaceae bacterium TAV1]
MSVPASASVGSLDPSALVAEAVALGASRGFSVEIFAEVTGVPLVALIRPAPPDRPQIYLSAGIHGDEPAPPRALLRLLESGVFDNRAGWTLVPMLNPAGFRLRTRENADGVDLNRDYFELRTTEVTSHLRWLKNRPSFHTVFCLHEDWESLGFYLYELNPAQRPSLADAMIAAAARHIPAEASPMIDGRPTAAPGLIRPDFDPATHTTGAEAVYLCRHHTTLSYTLETPSALALDLRIETMVAAVRAGLDALLGKDEQPAAVDGMTTSPLLKSASAGTPTGSRQTHA